MTTTTDKDALIALAERCEAAAGPDIRLDREIGALLWREPPYFSTPNWQFQSFTASLDAAMGLVPEGWLWARDIDQIFCLYPPDSPSPEIGFHESCDALALCAAALRARTTQGRDK